jgi:hypothetical protein
MFQNVRSVDASHSTFNNAGRDLSNVVNFQTSLESVNEGAILNVGSHNITINELPGKKAPPLNPWSLPMCYLVVNRHAVSGSSPCK